MLGGKTKTHSQVNWRSWWVVVAGGYLSISGCCKSAPFRASDCLTPQSNSPIGSWARAINNTRLSLCCTAVPDRAAN